MGATRYLPISYALSLAASQHWWLAAVPVVTRRQVAAARLELIAVVLSIGAGKPVCRLVGSHAAAAAAAAAAAFEEETGTAYPRPATGQQRMCWRQRLLQQPVIVLLPSRLENCLNQLAPIASQTVRETHRYLGHCLASLDVDPRWHQALRAVNSQVRAPLWCMMGGSPPARCRSHQTPVGSSLPHNGQPP